MGVIFNSTKTIFRAFGPVIIMFALVVTGCSGPRTESVVSVRAEVGARDTGRALGTLFEAHAGSTICRAGFQYSAQTRGVSASRHLELYCDDGDAAPAQGVEVSRIDRPMPGVYRAEIRSLGDTVIELVSGRVLTDAGWAEIDMALELDPTLFDLVGEPVIQDIQTVGNGALSFPHGYSAVYYNGDLAMPYRGGLRMGHYYDGRIYVAHLVGEPDFPAGISFCDWAPGEPRCEDITSLVWPERNDVYAMMGVNGMLLIAAGGNPASEDPLWRGAGIWRLDPEAGTLDRLYPQGDTIVNGEFYGMLRLGDNVLAGHYPSGYVLEFDPETGEGQMPPVPPVSPGHYGTTGLDALYREAQTLNFYAGRVWVGQFPWGMIQVSRPDLDLWEEFRLFRFPDVDGDFAPFGTELRTRQTELFSRPEAQLDVKYAQDTLWGQRIHTAAPIAAIDGLAYGLGNMPGLPYDAFRDGPLGS